MHRRLFIVEASMYYDVVRDMDAPRFYESVLYHRESPRRFQRDVDLCVSRAAEKGLEELCKVGDLLHQYATDTRMLYRSWCRMASRGGQSPGPNGHRYSDVSGSDLWNLLRLMSGDLRSGRYCRGGAKRVSFLKDPDNPARGRRTIHLLNIEDRVVQRAVAEVLKPIVERILADTVFGFRSQRNVGDALLAAERIAVPQRQWVWVSEDLRNAFDRVPVNRLDNVVRKYVPSAKLADLVMRLVSTGRKLGIPQGGPLSPLLLNLYLHHFLDSKWAERHPDVPLLRYADDLLLLCRTTAQAAACWSDLREMLRPAGMLLKGQQAKDVTTCLRKGSEVRWLGMRIMRAKDHLRFRVSKAAFARLKYRLERAHHAPAAPLRANACVLQWLSSLGPCYPYENRSRILSRTEETLRGRGFDEPPDRDVLRDAWQRGHESFADQRVRRIAETQPSEVVGLVENVHSESRTTASDQDHPICGDSGAGDSEGDPF